MVSLGYGNSLSLNLLVGEAALALGLDMTGRGRGDLELRVDEVDVALFEGHFAVESCARGFGALL